MLCYFQPSPKTLKPSTLKSIISLIFPHNLKFLSHASLTFASVSPTNINSNTLIRQFYTRSGPNGPRFSSGQDVRASKTLVDDEEGDLSDCVGGFSSKGIKNIKLYSHSEKHSDGGSNRDGECGFGDRFGGERERGGRNGDSRGSGGGMEGLGDTKIGGEDSRRRFEMESMGGREIRGQKIDTRRLGFLLSDDDDDDDDEEEEDETKEQNLLKSFKELTGSDEDDDDEQEDESKEQYRFKSFKELSGSDEDDDEEDDDESTEQNGFQSFKELSGSDEKENDESDKEEEDLAKMNKESVLASSQKEDGERTSPSSGGSYFTQSRFDQFSVSPLTLKGLKDLGIETMTEVQEATLPVILKGKDVMAKAMTGTGKTLAFLLPSIEAIQKTPPASRDQRRPPILVVVVCPTGELAGQVAAEAEKLLKYHPSLGVQVVIGGTRLRPEQKRLKAYPCQMIVATPGKLRVHIENTPGFAARVSRLKVLVFDEADHLLDKTFRNDIERIIAALPKQRQTLLFSTSIPPEVRQICYIALRRDYEYINTIEEGREETHPQVQQTHLVATLDSHFPILYTLLKEHIADNVNYKVLVFCITSMVTRLIAELLAELHLNVREIHSRKLQSHMTKVSDEFRNSRGIILVTSDISARGLDYPDVTLVVQLGMPFDRQQYIHRVGRTGRKGKEGQGILLLAPFEEFFLSTIKDLPITKAPIPLVDPESRRKVERSLSYVGRIEKESAYQEWLGYYTSSKIGSDKYRLVELANEFSRTMGLDAPPRIPHKIRSQMGLSNIPGLRHSK